MSLNVRLPAPRLSRLVASKPKDSKSNAPKANDDGSNETSIDIPMAEEEAVTSIIHFTDEVKERETFYLKLLKSSLDDETLSDLRSNIAGLTDSIGISRFPFCGRKGDVVPDSFYIQDYLKECLGIDTEQAQSIDIYMKDVSTSQKPDAKANAGGVIGAERLAVLKSKVDDTAFKWITGTQAKYVPELEQRDWAVISDSNSLCYGIRLIRVKDSANTMSEDEKADPRGIPVGIERARFPAFRLKKTTIWSDNIPTSTIEDVKLDLRIPDHVIDDRSYVSIYETETEMQTSMASRKSMFVQLGGRLFSTEDVSGSSAASTEEKIKSMKAAAAASFSGWGVSVDVSASHGKGSESKETKTSHEAVSDLTWQANGGDTLLCNQSKEWAPTVAYHWNWRVTKQDHVASIFDVAAQIKGMDCIIKKAIPLGLTIDPNFEDAVAKLPDVAPLSKKAFTLNKISSEGRYLLTYPASACNIAIVAQTVNSAKEENIFKIVSGLRSWGCVCLGPEKAESNPSLRLYEVENIDGKVQDEVRYNTMYRLKNKERALYVDFYTVQGQRLLSANPLRNLGQNLIPDKATVELKFYDEVTEEPKGNAYSTAKDAKNEYLFCSPTFGDRLLLTLRYK